MNIGDNVQLTVPYYDDLHFNQNTIYEILDEDSGHYIIGNKDRSVYVLKTEVKPAPKIIKSGTKHDQDKPAIGLIPHEAIFAIGQAMTYGAKKYDAHNWRGGFKWLRLASACNRHLWAWIGGQNLDPESGLSHLAHAGACVAMLIGHVESNLGEDDRWKS